MMDMHETISELVSLPPTPTLAHPMAQFDWLVRQYVAPRKNSKTTKNIRRSMNYYKEFLRQEHGYDERLAMDSRLFLNIHWDNFTFYNFHYYMTHRGLSPLTAASVLKIFRRILRYAIARGYTAVNFLISPSIGPAKRATDGYDPYGEEELNYIRIAIQPAITRANKIVQPYRRTGKGRDPRRPEPEQDEWRHIDNVVWYFENVLSCRRLSHSQLINNGHADFCQAVRDYHGGLSVFYDQIGARPPVREAHYDRKHVGEDPRMAPVGWANIDNAIWYFENRLDCQVLSMNQLNASGHSGFLNAVAKYHGGLIAFYVRIGALAAAATPAYVRKNIGDDPQKPHDGWSKLENAVWYFENRLDCQALGSWHLQKTGHSVFVGAINKYHGGFSAFYKTIGAQTDSESAPYVRKNVGEDPQIRRDRWAAFENVVWYFENRLDCQVPSSADLVAGGHSSFAKALSRYHGGAAAFYARIGARIEGGPLPYVRRNVGEDPVPRPGMPTSAWWKLDNLIWYFENVLHCVPLGALELIDHGHRAFYKAAIKHHGFGSLDAFYAAIGVTWVDVPQPYARRNVGKDPRFAEWADFDDVVWYFENVMDCRALSKAEARKAHADFVKACELRHGGLKEVYRRLGVAVVIDYKLLVPLLIKLAWETGLNPETVLSLKRDCYVPVHPLGNTPYLRFHKERGVGDSVLILRLLDLPEDPQEGETGILPLLPKQSAIIENTIRLIRELTEPLVEHAGHYKDCLFLTHMLDQGVREDGTPITYPSDLESTHVGRLSRRMLDAWRKVARSQIERLKKENPDDGDLQALEHPKHLNLARFRSTLVARMVRDGVDFFHISAAMGHANARTTFSYLRSWQFNEQFRRELSEHLQAVHENKQAFEADPKPYATEENLEKLGPDGVVFKGIMCDCKNAFSIPDKIKAALKRAGRWQEGMPCSYYDMCLACPNVLVTRRNLPLLMQHYMEIEASVAANSMSQAPNAPLYRKKKAILEGIFDEFDEEDIEWARETALNANVVIDPMTWRGTRDE